MKLFFHLFIIVFSGQVFASKINHSIPVSSEKYTQETSQTAVVCNQLYRVVWPKYVKTDETFICRMGIYQNDLIVSVLTDSEITQAPIRTAPYFKTDSFAVLIDPARNFSTFYSIAADFTDKSKVEFFQYCSIGYRKKLNVHASSTISKENGKTMVTLRIPLGQLGIKPGAGDLWGISCMRYTLINKKPVLCVGSIPINVVKFRDNNHFPTPRHFKTFQIGETVAGISLTRGNLAKEEIFSENRFAYTYINPEENGQATFTVQYRSDAKSKPQLLGKTPFSYLKNEPQVINIPYDCPADKGIMTFVIRKNNGGILYQSSYPVMENPKEALITMKGKFTKDRLKMEVDPRLKGDTILTWPHNISKNFMITTNAIPMAYPYSYESWLDYLKETGRIEILSYPGTWQKVFAKHAPEFRKSGLKCALSPTALNAKDAAPYKHLNQLFLLDPKVRKAYMESLTTAISQYPDTVKYIYVNDEFSKGMTTCLMHIWPAKRKDYPFLNTLDEDVKKRFGFGKYGLPLSYKDDRFKWLAYRRWLADFVENFSKEVIQKSRAIKPDIMFVSPDPATGHKACYFESWKGLFDIATHQVFWSNKIPFDCKVLKDLAETPHIWPCPHIESLATSWAPNQIQKILSESFMAGADGLMTWPCVARDAAVRPDRIDSPGSTEMITEFGQLMKKGYKPNHGKPEVGVLYSNDTFCAAPFALTRGLSIVYQALGPVLGAGFKFIGDLGLERGYDKLEDYKILLVPYADVERRNVVEKIFNAVNDGLFLVVLQQNAFTYDLDGSRHDHLLKRFLGNLEITPVPKTAKTKPNVIWYSGRGMFNGVKGGMTYTGIPRTFKHIQKNAEIAFYYYDKKTPAGIIFSIGKGKVLWLGTELPYDKPYIKSHADFFKHIFKHHGIGMDQPAWRIKLPLKFSKTPVKGIFYTGNYYGLEFQIPQIIYNSYVPGSYQYSLPPDDKAGWNKFALCSDIGNNQPIPFSEGSLTDRGRPTRIGVKFKKTDSFHIDVDLKANLPVKEVDIYVSGYIPKIELHAGNDGENFKLINSNSVTQKFSGVDCCPLKTTNGEKYRYLRIHFSERPKNIEFIIAEIDIIGPSTSAGETLK